MKTTLKTAKFTFKTAVTRCVAVKMRCCGGGFMIDCVMFCRGCGGFNVFFRRLRCLFAVKMWCGNGKIRCENGKIRCGNGGWDLRFRLKFIVLRRLRGAFRRMRWWFPAFRLPRWRNGGAIAAVGGVVAGFSCLVSL